MLHCRRQLRRLRRFYKVLVVSCHHIFALLTSSTLNWALRSFGRGVVCCVCEDKILSACHGYDVLCIETVNCSVWLQPNEQLQFARKVFCLQLPGEFPIRAGDCKQYEHIFYWRIRWSLSESSVLSKPSADCLLHVFVQLKTTRRGSTHFSFQFD